MPYERSAETLDKATETVLADPEIEDHIGEAHLHRSQVIMHVRKCAEDAWNAAGMEIEEYGNTEARLSLNEKELEARTADLAESARRIFPFVRLPSPESPDALGVAFSLVVSSVIALVITYFVSGDMSLDFIRQRRLPSFGNAFMLLTIAAVVVSSTAAVLIGIASARFRSKQRELEKPYDLDGLRNALAEQAKKIEEALVLKGLFPIVRSFIGKNLDRNYETVLPRIEPLGLGEVHDASLEVEVDAKRRLLSMFDTMEGGSIGIAGPRGAGKTTLMRMFCDERSWELRRRPVLSVMTPAPAQYDPRDFILHLFFVVCRRLCRLHNIDVDQIVWTHENPRLPAPRLLLDRLSRGKAALRAFGMMFVAAAFVLGFGAVIAGFSSPPSAATNPKPAPTASAPNANSAPSTNSPSAPGNPASSGSAGNANNTGTAVSSPGMPASTDNGTPTGGNQSAGTGATTASGAATNGAAAKPAASSGPDRDDVLRTLTIFSNLGVTPANLLIWGMLFLALSFLPEVLSLPPNDEEASQKLRGDRIDFETAVTRTEHPLVIEALRRLRSIKFQQNYTAGWSGGLKFPLGIDGGMKGDVAMQERPLSLPEIVSNFREFLRRLGEEYWVIIGIDELDKIHPDEAAERFLNDIKIIFGVEKVYYLISVSENVLSSFERRGIPLRNAFDSCFDEILRVRYLTLEGAAELLRRRVLGMPFPFVCLCQCLAGGLPRDLIRGCRNILLAGQDRSRDLGELCVALLKSDVGAKLHSIETAASDLALGLELVSFLETLRNLESDWSAQAPALIPELMKEVIPPIDDDDVAKAYDKLNRLRAELGIYLWYATTVLNFFTNRAVGKAEFEEADRNGSFEAIAKLRQALAINHGLAGLLAKQITDKLSPAASAPDGSQPDALPFIAPSFDQRIDVVSTDEETLADVVPLAPPPDAADGQPAPATK